MGQTALHALSTEDVAAIRQGTTDFRKHALAGDWDALADLYVEDCVVMPPNHELVVGRAATRDLFAVLTVSAFELEPVEVDGLGDIGFSRGTYSWTISVDGGEPVADRGKWLVVWRKQATGSWLVTQDIWNSDLAS